MRRRPIVIPVGAPAVFPDPRAADDEGLVAVGGDLSVGRLLAAYGAGIFPWYEAGLPPLWWSPNPRAVIELEALHVSRSLRRLLARGELAVTLDQAFRRVMVECGARRGGGTWIIPEMVEAYTALHEQGHAHSFEVWQGRELVGGLYGVQCGALFAAESMFHRTPNASKVALVTAVRTLFAAGIELFDVQFVTPHLRSLGATPIPREVYLGRVEAARHRHVEVGGVVGGSKPPGRDGTP